MPFKRGVFVASPRELERCECFYLSRDSNVVHPVAGVYRLGDETLGAVAVHFLIEHSVKNYLDAIVVKRFNGSFKLGPCAIFGGDGPLLVKLSEVIQVVCSIAYIIDASTFVGWWNPYG